MAPIFGRLLASLLGGSCDRASVRRLLQQSECERAPMELSPPLRGGRRQRPISVSIAKVKEDEFVILGAAEKQLAIGDTVTLSISRSNGRTTVRSRVRGALRLAGGTGNRQSVGYRLSIPRRIKVVNNRDHFRVRLDGPSPIEATLQRAQGGTRMRGVLRDLSRGGACVEIDSSTNLTQGSRLVLLADLPQPGGPIAEPATAVRVTPGRTGRLLVGMKFDKEARSLDAFLRYTQAERAKRAKRLKQLQQRAKPAKTA